MDDKIVKVKFEEWQEKQYNEDLKQWNYGQILQVEGLTVPDGKIEVHFSLDEISGKAPVSIGTAKDNVITVEMPLFIFQKQDNYCSSYEAYAFIYVTDEESGVTERKIVFTVKGRPEPTANVPKDEQEQFLKEVREVMAETKEIAQSVREDADNGVFDGEQGPQGEPGVIEYIPVIELPTENIKNAIYLLKREVAEGEEEEADNLYDEYIYTNGAWELFGSKPIKLNLSMYIKNTDVATNSKLGLVMAHSNYGVGVTSDGLLVIYPATDEQIKLKTENNRPIVPKNIDMAVKCGLTDSQIEWTEKERQLGRTQLDAIGKTEYPTTPSAGQTGTYGVVRIRDGLGISCAFEGALYIVAATEALIKEGKNVYQPIAPSVQHLSAFYGLLKAAQTEELEYTDAEKTAVLGMLGGVGQLSCESDDTLLKGLAYIVNRNNEQESVELRVNAIGGTIPMRDASGNTFSQLPTNDYHSVPKKYVDDLVGDVQTILTELHTYAETLQSGGES